MCMCMHGSGGYKGRPAEKRVKMRTVSQRVKMHAVSNRKIYSTRSHILRIGTVLQTG